LSHQAAQPRLFSRLRKLVNMRAGFALSATSQALVHDTADGARAPPALRAAAETAVDLVRGGWPGGCAIDRRPHVAVGKNVAGTNDHAELGSPTQVTVALI